MFNWILGCGQGGSRLAKEISDVFNIPGRYINLADIDYSSFDAPSRHKLIVDGDGTGRKATLGEKITREHIDVIEFFLNSALRENGNKRICMCVGGGGGSGTGLMLPILEFFSEEFPELDIFLIYTIPRKAEGLPAKPQALTYLNKLVKNFISENISVMLIDNDYAGERYAEDHEMDVEYWKHINRGIAGTLKRFHNLTQLDTVDHIDATSGVGALDLNELLSVLFFKQGFVDLCDFTISYPDAEEIKSLIKNGSCVFKNLDIRTSKAYSVAIAMPEKWKGHKETNNFVDAVFDILGRMTKTTYVLRSSFYSKRLREARIMCVFAGITEGRGLEKIIRQTAKDKMKFKKKGKVKVFNLSGRKKKKN